MEPIVLIHGYSAESSDTTPQAIHDIYGTFPDGLRAVYGAANVIEVDVSRYVTLEDGVTIDDISRALDRALRQDHAQLFASGFNVLVHSTGALVIRNWVRTFSGQPSPVKRILYLAGANFGSGWAHIGKGQLAKWARFVFQAGAESGVRVLDALELGSSWTLDLNVHFMRRGSRMRADYGIFEFVIVGTQADVKWFEAPIRYAREDGSDGVVRVSASNVNTHYMHFRSTKAAQELAWPAAAAQEQQHLQRTGQRDSWYERVEAFAPGLDAMPQIPFAIPYQCAHTGDDMGIVIGKQPRDQVIRLVRTALGVSSDPEWQAAGASFDAETDLTFGEARKFQAPGFWKHLIDEPRAQYDAHAQIVFRVRDQDGRPVEHFDIFFDSESTPEKSIVPIRDLLEDRHVNDTTPNVIAFYLRTHAWSEQTGDWEPRLPDVRGLYLEVSATEPQTDQIAYLPMRYELTSDELVAWIAPHRTTVIDIELLRLPSDRIFMMVKA